MGVGNQPDRFSLMLQKQQEFDHKRMNGNQVLNLFFQQRNVKLQAIRPVVQIGPVERILLGPEQGIQVLSGKLQIFPVACSPTGRNMFHPEMVIEMPVEQGSVHIQQNGVYVVPVYLHREIRIQQPGHVNVIFHGEQLFVVLKKYAGTWLPAG